MLTLVHLLFTTRPLTALVLCARVWAEPTHYSPRMPAAVTVASQARAAGPVYSLLIHGRRGIVVSACLLVVSFFRFRTIGIVVLLCLVLRLFLLGFCRSLSLCLLVFEYNA